MSTSGTSSHPFEAAVLDKIEAIEGAIAAQEQLCALRCQLVEARQELVEFHRVNSGPTVQPQTLNPPVTNTERPEADGSVTPSAEVEQRFVETSCDQQTVPAIAGASHSHEDAGHHHHHNHQPARGGRMRLLVGLLFLVVAVAAIAVLWPYLSILTHTPSTDVRAEHVERTTHSTRNELREPYLQTWGDNQTPDAIRDASIRDTWVRRLTSAPSRIRGLAIFGELDALKAFETLEDRKIPDDPDKRRYVHRDWLVNAMVRNVHQWFTDESLNPRLEFDEGIRSMRSWDDSDPMHRLGTSLRRARILKKIFSDQDFQDRYPEFARSVKLLHRSHQDLMNDDPSVLYQDIEFEVLDAMTLINEGLKVPEETQAIVALGFILRNREAVCGIVEQGLDELYNANPLPITLSTASTFTTFSDYDSYVDPQT